MTDKQKDLCVYRFAQAEETIRSAQLCFPEKPEEGVGQTSKEKGNKRLR